jgi:hypothetical protein
MRSTEHSQEQLQNQNTRLKYNLSRLLVLGTLAVSPLLGGEARENRKLGAETRIEQVAPPITPSAHNVRANVLTSKQEASSKQLPDTSPLSPAFLAEYGKPSPGYSYVMGADVAYSRGLSATLTQSQPKLAPSGPNVIEHSLAEISVLSEDGLDTVETGEMVSTATDNRKPRFFVYEEDGGYSNPDSGYGKGFVQVSKTMEPGEVVPAGKKAEYSISYDSTNQSWDVGYNGDEVGYFPESDWTKSAPYAPSFNISIRASAFGEVYQSNGGEGTQMGNGDWPSNPKAASITNFKLIGSDIAPDLEVLSSNRKAYKAAAVTDTSFRFGGPGIH